MPAYYLSESMSGQTVIIRVEPGSMTSFTENPENVDWVAYQEWVAEGNTPEPWPPAE
jgi:hypothetical protein